MYSALDILLMAYEELSESDVVLLEDECVVVLETDSESTESRPD